VFGRRLFSGMVCAFLLSVAACSTPLHFGLNPYGNAERQLLVPQWRVDLYDPPPLSLKPQERSSVAYYEGLLISGGADGVVRALEGHSGQLKWAFETGEQVVARPLVFGGAVVVGSFDGYLYSFSLENGEVLWRYNTGAPILSIAASLGGRVFVSNNRNALFALDFKTGKYLWSKARSHRSEFTIDGQAGILAMEGVIYAGYSDGHLVAMEPEDGTTLWSVDLGGKAERFADVDTTPIVRDGHLYAASFRGGFYALDRKTGAVIWHHQVEGASDPVFHGDRVFFSTATGEVRCLDTHEGAVIWRTKLAQIALSQPRIVGPFVLLATGESLVLLRASSGSAMSTWTESDGFMAVPEVAAGMVYAFSNQGTLYGINWYTDELE
jgi:outer membrane protein assembly factor BamB